MEYKEEYGWLTNICLNVTDACNLACRYCFVEQNPHYMSLETAKKAVHFVLDNLEKKNKKFGTEEKGNIIYFGGEPTLMWDEIIVPLTLYIRENNFPITLNMTTNGTLLSEDRLKFLFDNEVYIMLSMDGAEETQNYNRPCRFQRENSFDLIIKNIPYILKYYPNITFRATIYADTVNKTYENFLFAVACGFKSVYFLPDSRHPWTSEQKAILEQEIDKIYAFLETFLINNRPMPISFSMLDRSFQGILKNDMYVKGCLPEGEMNITRTHSIDRCGLAITLGSIGYNGSIYGCQEQTSKGEDSYFYLGNIFLKGIEKKRHLRLLEAYEQPIKKMCENKTRCNKCLAKNICHENSCPSTSFDLFNKFFTASEINCIFYEKLFKNSIVLLHRMVDENNLIFKKYLEDKCYYKRMLLIEEGENNE